MGNERYTSPALSRDLAEAGMEQHIHEYCSPQNMRCCHYPYWSQFEDEWVINERGNVYTASPLVRALDLTDCLHEIEKRGATWLIEMADGMYCMTADLGKCSAVMGGPTAAEAAGLCLLALMDKEREAKP